MRGRPRAGGYGRRPSLGRQNLGFVRRFPHLMPKLLWNVGRAAAGRRVLRGVEFAITYRCNLACPHCLRVGLETEARPELSCAEILDAARQIARLGGIFINLTGGEPILREDLVGIVGDVARVRGLLVTLASNGWALTEDLLRRLRKAGLSMVALSLDGAAPESHDAFRQAPGLFERVTVAARAARGLGLGVLFTAVATREALAAGELRRLADLAAREGFPLTLNLPYPVGAWSGRDVALGPAEYAEYLALLRLPHVRWEGSSNWIVEGCPAGVEKLYITPYGDVFPCAVIQESFGNLRAEPLAAIYERIGRHPCFSGGRKPCLVAEAPELLARVSAPKADRPA